MHANIVGGANSIINAWQPQKYSADLAVTVQHGQQYELYAGITLVPLLKLCGVKQL